MKRPLAELVDELWRVGQQKGNVKMGASKCLTEDCHRYMQSTSNYARGLCMVCYGKAKKLVESGVTSWDQLEKLGLVNSAETTDPFTKAFNQATKME